MSVLRDCVPSGLKVGARYQESSLRLTWILMLIRVHCIATLPQSHNTYLPCILLLLHLVSVGEPFLKLRRFLLLLALDLDPPPELSGDFPPLAQVVLLILRPPLGLPLALRLGLPLVG